MLANVSSSFEFLPYLRSLFEESMRICATMNGRVLTAHTPFMVFPDGSLYEGKIQEVALLFPGTRHSRYDLWDELLLVSHGIERNRYSSHELACLENWSRYIISFLDEVIETVATETVPVPKFILN